MSELVFPPDFQFGVSTSAYQTEGDIENDWAVWERKGKLKDPNARCGKACDHWNRFVDDIELIAATGATMYRLSLEWARIEPEPGTWSDAALNGYRTRLEALVKRGIRPVVTLHHFTHPQWFHDTSPWHEAKSLESWVRYAKKCAELLDGLNAAVITFNEPMVFLMGGYLSNQMPPAINDPKQVFPAFANLIRAHVIARQALLDRAKSKPVAIGISQNVVMFAASRRWHPLDHALTRLVNNNYNHAFLEALTTGKAELSMPGLLSGRTGIDGAAGSTEYTGINYYTRAHLRFVAKPPFLEFHYRDSHRRTLTDIGWEYYPEGFGFLLRRMKDYGKPVWVTENGLDDRSGNRRSQFLYDHWRELLLARADGVDITTYLHWSLMDNFEWLEAWGPRFGLYRVDFNTLERSPTPARDYFRQIATSRVLTPPPTV